MKTTEKRMSIRNVALTYGIPSRAVARAVDSGDLPAVKIATETGRERSYIAKADADAWFSALFTSGASVEDVQV